MLTDTTPDQRRLVLEGMADIARASGSLGVGDRDGIRGAASLLLPDQDPDALDVDALAVTTPEAVAEAIVADDQRNEAMQYLIVAAFTSGEVDTPRWHRLVHYAEALGVAREELHILRELADRHWHSAQFHLMRDTMEVVTESDRWLSRGYELLKGIVGHDATDDPELAARYRALGDLPENTLGYGLFRQYVDHGFAFPGEPDNIGEVFGIRHDTCHVLSGYSTSRQGELLVGTFSTGMEARFSPVEPFHVLMLPLFTWHLGTPLLPRGGNPGHGVLDVRKLFVAWERGKATTLDVYGPDFDLFEQAERDLDEVRAAWNITPLDPADAAIGNEELPDYVPQSAT